MSARIWELHAHSLGGAIRTTPGGEADIEGLVLSEKAYLLAMRDFRPYQLLELVRREGCEGAARQLLRHFSAPGSIAASGGRALVATRGLFPGAIVRRSDEVGEVAISPRRL